MSTTSERLIEALSDIDITQAELARRTGLGRPAISQYMSGKVKPKQDNIYILAKALKVSPTWLMGFNVPKDIPEDLYEGDYTDEEKFKDDYETASLFSDEDINYVLLKAIFDTLKKMDTHNLENSRTILLYLLKKPSVYSLLKKYRSLDTLDQRAVDGLLDTLSERVNIKEQPQETEHATLIHENRLYMTFYDYGASAGTGNYLDEWDIPKSTISVPDNPETRKADFVLRVCGESMEPDYHDGDRVLVKSQDSVNLNDIAIYIIDGESYIKQYKGSYLHSLNPSYGDIQMNEGQAIKCVGKVIGKL